jgi:nicotinamide-nucleotide amidase
VLPEWIAAASPAAAAAVPGRSGMVQDKDREADDLMLLRAEVIAIGDELTTGQRLDTNSRWLSAELATIGIPVAFHTTAPDTLEAGIEAFRVATGRADFVLATGGLGPTADDLTRDVLAALGGAPLELDAAALAAVESRFARRSAPMPASNRRQAMFPRGSRIIPNPDGTAPGIDLDIVASGRRSRVFALPGVPAEMRTMWQASVLPALLAALPDRGTIVQRRIKCYGAGESAIEAMLPDLVRRGRDPLVGITAHEATITLRIAARGRDEADCRARIATTEATIRDCLGPLVFGAEDDEVEDAALRALASAGRSLAVVEVGTAGRVAALLASAQALLRPAAEAGGFRAGLVLAPGAEPPAFLGVDRSPGPDGRPPAATVAARAREAFGTDLGLAVGPARPGPEGRATIDIALASAAGVERSEHLLGGGPDIVLARAAKAAIDFLRLALAAGKPEVCGR